MKKALKIVVLAKQVPDTRNVGKDAMTPEGTVNRAALPAIFNPEDLNALEMALALKDETEGSTVHILTMGPPRAADIIRDAMFRGADGVYLLTDRKFAGADTLATSYALSCALRKIRPDVIVAGRQAIDGDTAQVGPQVAEKLGWPQVTYAEELLEIKADSLVVKRRLEHGTEIVECPLPLVMTVNGTAPECRPRHAKLVMKYKHAITPSECQLDHVGCYAQLRESRPYLNITEWGVADVDADDLLGVGHLRPVQLLGDLRPDLSRIAVDGLTASDDDVGIHLERRARQRIGGSQRIGTRELTVGQQHAPVGTAEHPFADNLRSAAGPHRQDLDPAARKHVLEHERLLQRIEVLGIEDSGERRPIDRAVGLHSVLAHVAGIGHLLGQHNYFQRFLHHGIYLVFFVLSVAGKI